MEQQKKQQNERLPNNAVPPGFRFAQPGEQAALGTSARRSRKDTNKITLKFLTPLSGANFLKDTTKPMMIQVKHICEAPQKKDTNKITLKQLVKQIVRAESAKDSDEVRISAKTAYARGAEKTI